MADRFYFGLTVPAIGERVQLSPDESQHLTRVMRVRVGEPVIVFGGGREFAGILTSASARAALVEIQEERPALPPPKLHVTSIIPSLKGGKTELLLQKLTEMGVAGFTVFRAEREIAKSESARIQKLQRVVIEACKQCGRSDVPCVSVASCMASAFDTSLPGFVLYEEATERFAPLIATAVLASSHVQIATGPEGGITPAEIASVSSFAKVVSLGSRILRAETAPTVAATIALVASGDI